MLLRPASDPCIVSLSPLPGRDELAPVWQDLEGRAEASVFLSWAWIGALLPFLSPQSQLLQVTRGDTVIGLGVLGRKRTLRLAGGESLHLNEIGDSCQDRINIEYNGMLAERGADAEVRAAILAALTECRTPAWRRLYLSGVPAEWAAAPSADGFDLRALRHAQAAPYADFAAMTPGDPLSALSRNSRQQIRRSLRLYEQRGPLSLARAASPEQALDWCGELEKLHRLAWQAKGKPGAFDNPAFDVFHRDLISRSFHQGVPDLLCAKAGDSVIGYLYNFRWRGVVYAYQSGFQYEEDADCRPGLVSHLLAMRLYRSEGMVCYRFLAGDYRYKRSLANGEDKLYWVVLSRRDLVHRLEGLARQVRDLVIGGTAGGNGKLGEGPE